MAELRLSPIEDLFTGSEIKKLIHELEELGAGALPKGDDDLELEESLTDDQLTDFMDRLEAQDIGCSVYLPMEFDGIAEIGEHVVGSAHALLDVLEEMQDELEVDEDEEDDEEFGPDVIEEGLRHAWHVFVAGANRCIEQQMPLQVVS